MKGVIYARYSSDNQREESIEGQLRECKEYAERNDITILGTYIDRALSAKTDNRPEFQHMIKESAKGLFDVVLVWKLDRFARNRYDSARYKNLLKKNGVKVISARENISEGSEGIILEAMLEGYAEYYSAELSEKVIRGLTDNALKCKYNGGTVPMGYYIDEQQYYQIDPKTAPVVLEMFTKYSEGATMQELVNLLNSRGMRSIRGGKITLNIMNHLLKNRRYMGEYSYRDVVKENGIPAIVPKELFERVQERLTSLPWRPILPTGERGTAGEEQKGSRSSQSRGRLPFDNEAVLWEMRLLYGGRKRHKPYNESTPLLSLCKYQEKEALRQESGQERLD